VLFERDARGMKLTALGELFHQCASAVGSELRRAKDELAQVQGDDDGELVMMVALASTDLVAMLPVQWGEFAPLKDALRTLPLREKLAAPSIVLVPRADLPRTPRLS
jgi:hypothetical protein